eukprot:3551691-Pyramimonas_sp.AAC.1
MSVLIDSSPQGGHDVFNAIVDLFVQTAPTSELHLDSLGGFTFFRRRLPVSTLGHTDTASKLTKLVNMILLEIGEENFMRFREGAKHLTSDQG